MRAFQPTPHLQDCSVDNGTTVSETRDHYPRQLSAPLFQECPTLQARSNQQPDLAPSRRFWRLRLILILRVLFLGNQALKRFLSSAKKPLILLLNEFLLSLYVRL